MKIFVDARPHSQKESIVQLEPNHFRVAVKELPVDGMANEGVERLVAEYFDVPKSRVSVIKGHTSRKKVVEIL
jgi:hypothetical protein